MDALPGILGGLVLLALGGELLVRGAVRVAERLGVSPLLIGLTLLGFGTSTPELVTSLQASLAGSPGIAVGNIVGSNIANILLILGLAAMVAPVAVASRALARDGVIGLLAALALTGAGFAAQLGRPVGGAFLLGLLLYLLLSWRQERQEGASHGAAYAKSEAFEGAHPHGLRGAVPQAAGLALPLSLALGGLVLVVLGGRLLVDGAVALARVLAIPEAVIGLTIVAIGTSMPELVTSLVAAFRRQGEVAFGNLLGSNIYNVLGIGGATALIAPTPVPAEILALDIWVMLGASLLLLLVARTGWRVGRREGVLLFAGYLGYLWAVWPG
ncbi:calcium/sodium antiporter [Roseicella sp. GB24]|uniref:Calcium/sodium antiporter n=2 Tax=Roseicella aerolata TaxID=2883479 RepID=A0A9X1L8P9_9PROT|nr:calcium/sodium antiporter [Roseicella aerolata]MCB4822729.1 calcium/sodium antiporter [Roseicella aerolata]